MAAPMSEDGKLRQNLESGQFELILQDVVSTIDFEQSIDRIILGRAFTPEELRGRGYAARVARYALEHARSQQLRVEIRCPYIKDFVDKNPEFADLVD